MSVPLFATRDALEPLLGEVAERQRAVLESGRYILGPEVEAFEAEFADWLGVANCVGVANGTDALTIALRALGIGPADEVVVPAFTFYATAEAVVNAGAVPVFCDVDPATLTMTAATAEAAIGAAHRGAAPGPPLRQSGSDGGAAPALRRLAGCACWRTRPRRRARCSTAGGRGRSATARCFSFFPSKNLGGFGDGGAMVSDDDDVAAAARRLRAHGSADRANHTEVGYNSRLDELQAAGLRVLLPQLGDWTRARRAAAAAYEGNGLGDAVGLPVETGGGESCFHLYVIRTGRRRLLEEALAGRGIGARAYYSTPLHRQPAMRPFAPAAPLPGVERAAAESLALPMGPALGEQQVQEVVAAVAAAMAA